MMKDLLTCRVTRGELKTGGRHRAGNGAGRPVRAAGWRRTGRGGTAKAPPPDRRVVRVNG